MSDVFKGMDQCPYCLTDTSREMAAELRAARDRYKKERDELLLGMADCIEVKQQRDQLLEGIEAHRVTTDGPVFRDRSLYTLADQIKSKGGSDEECHVSDRRSTASPLATRGGSNQVDGVAPGLTSDDPLEQAAFELYAAGPWGKFEGFRDEGFRCATDAHDFKTYREMVALVAPILAPQDNEEGKLRELLDWCEKQDATLSTRQGHDSTDVAVDEARYTYQLVIGRIRSSLSSEAGS